MPRIWTADQILDASAKRYMVPRNINALGSDQQSIIDRINEWMFGELIGEIMGKREDYFHVTTQISAVENARFRINPRAMYQKLHKVRHLDSVGHETKPFVYMGSEEIRDVGAEAAKTPQAYYIEGSEIKLWPSLDSSSDGTLEQTFPFRPGELVLLDKARKITAVDTATGVITVNQIIPSAWDTAELYDIHSPYSGAEIKGWDKVATVASETGMTLTNIDGSVAGERAVAVGDYICLAGEAAVPGVPYEFHPLLVQAGAVALGEKFGEKDAVKLHQARLDREMKTALKGIITRVEGERKPVCGTRFVAAQGASYGGGR
jgi:hypothetical protein